MKTYYDIAIHTASKDVVNVKGVSYSQMMKIANDNPNLEKIEILKEYEKKENTNQSTGEPYFTYTVPLAEMIAVNVDGRETAYPMYEKAKENPSRVDAGMPRLQNSLVFPDFEEDLLKKPEEVKETTLEDLLVGDDAPISEMTITDVAAILWKKPVSNKIWLNSLIERQ